MAEFLLIENDLVIGGWGFLSTSKTNGKKILMQYIRNVLNCKPKNEAETIFLRVDK